MHKDFVIRRNGQIIKRISSEDISIEELSKEIDVSSGESIEEFPIYSDEEKNKIIFTLQQKIIELENQITLLNKKLLDIIGKQ